MKGLFAYLLLSLGVAHADETRRLVTHFDTVIAELQTADTGGLTPIARAARTRLIEALGAYRDARRFPRNPDFAKPTPYFIDGQGTRCAMAHLIEISGHSKLVEAVATTRNNAYIKDLADDPTLLTWLDAHGLTVAEAARIQPAYECKDAAECHCRLASGEEDVIYQATVSSIQNGAETVTVDAAFGGARSEPLPVGERIGADLKATTVMPLGQSVLGFVRDHTFVPTHVIENDRARCVAFHGELGRPTVNSLYTPTVDLIGAALSADCRAAVEEYDYRFQDRCRDAFSDDCSQHPGNDSPLLAALLLGAVGWRKWR